MENIKYAKALILYSFKKEVLYFLEYILQKYKSSSCNDNNIEKIINQKNKCFEEIIELHSIIGSLQNQNPLIDKKIILAQNYMNNILFDILDHYSPSKIIRLRDIQLILDLFTKEIFSKKLKNGNYELLLDEICQNNSININIDNKEINGSVFTLEEMIASLIANLIIVDFINAIIKELKAIDGVEISIETVDKDNDKHTQCVKKVICMLNDKLKAHQKLLRDVIELKENYTKESSELHAPLKAFLESIDMNLSLLIAESYQEIYPILGSVIKNTKENISTVESIKSIIDQFYTIAIGDASLKYYQNLLSKVIQENQGPIGF